VDGRLQIFAGTSHPQLAAEIMGALEAPLGRAEVGLWRNGETRVKLEENVRGSDVFVIQSMSAPVDHHLMELLLIIDSLRRASAARITAVIPYFAYAKQEKKTTGREPISAKLVANLLTTAGADRILTMDLHSPARVCGTLPSSARTRAASLALKTCGGELGGHWRSSRSGTRDRTCQKRWRWSATSATSQPSSSTT
jgi:phosphoribosylpyrophosphate synthetase